jgi:hypothetical protein
MKPTDTTEIIRVASNVSVLFPLLAYLFKIKYASRRIHIIGILVIVSALADFGGYFLHQEKHSNVMLINTYYVLLFFLLTWFYYEIVFIKSRRTMIWIGLAVYLQSLILITIFVQGFSQFQTLLWLIIGIIMMVFSIEYFIYLISARPSVNLMNYTTMWINSGVLIYFGFNLFLYIMTTYVFTHMDLEARSVMWSFHNVNNIIKNILFGIGVTMHKRKIADF